MKALVDNFTNDVVGLSNHIVQEEYVVNMGSYLVSSVDGQFSIVEVPSGLKIHPQGWGYTVEEGFYEKDESRIRTLELELENQKAINEDLTLMMADIIAAL